DHIDITTGGSDVSVQTPGVTISLVSRSGTDQFAGSGRTWFTNHELVSSNFSSDLAARGATRAPTLKLYREYGADAGGPLIARKLWWWAGVGEQDARSLSHVAPTTGAYGQVWIASSSGDVIYNRSASQRAHVSIDFARKRTSDSGMRQSNTGLPTVTARYDWSPGGRWTLSALGGYDNGDFNIAFDPYDKQVIRRRSGSIETIGTLALR